MRAIHDDLAYRAEMLARRVARRAGERDLDEAASVGLAALAAAIRGYKRKRSASLSTYCYLVVSCRVRDWIRSERRYRERLRNYAERLRIRCGETDGSGF